MTRWRDRPKRTRLILTFVSSLVLVCVGVAIGVGLAYTGQSAAGPTRVQGPVVINTWFQDACGYAYTLAQQGYDALDVVEAGCTFCEDAQCDGTVGWGGSPDSTGETTLDAIIMDGRTMDVGAVAYLRNVKHAISAARKVMHYTTHTVLAGEGATNFSVMVDMPREDLHSNQSIQSYTEWVEKLECQPNFFANFENVTSGCPPYVPIPTPTPTPVPLSSSNANIRSSSNRQTTRKPRPANKDISQYNHDTIGMCVLDRNGNLAAGGSSNGANHKVAGRVGDVPIVGAAVYVDQMVGCAAGTGDGDITMRFLPAYQAVEFMRQGMEPMAACENAVRRIMRVYGTNFSIGLVCLNAAGQVGAASQGWGYFKYAIADPSTLAQPSMVPVPPLNP